MHLLPLWAFVDCSRVKCIITLLHADDGPVCGPKHVDALQQMNTVRAFIYVDIITQGDRYLKKYPKISLKSNSSVQTLTGQSVDHPPHLAPRLKKEQSYNSI
jgi:hypothetical protein